MKLTSHQIREKYLSFMESKGHAIVPSSPLIPENDPTTLFTGSWMQPMVPYLLGQKHPLWTRIADSQKCFRAWDIDEVWDTTHTTFFEMLGNWSLWDYFKTEQINWIWELYIDEFGIDPEKFCVTVFKGNDELWIPRDDEAIELWKEKFSEKWIEAKVVENPEEEWINGWKIFLFDEGENWWSRAGTPDKMPIWEPGWTDSEMFFDFGAELKLHENSQWKDQPCHPACDCGRFLEIWNNVFMKYIKTQNWFEELENKNIDLWGWLERIAVAISNTPDVYMGDIFDGIRGKIEEFSGKKYGENEKETKAFRVIMDHLRVVTFLIADGAFPSNKDQGYFTRRMLRRAIRFARDLGIESGLSAEVAKVVISEYKHHYTDLETKKEEIIKEIETEEKQFLTTLEKWLKEFEKLVTGFQIAFERSGKKIDTIAWPKAFKLYDTFGFPLEMTQELAEERDLKVDVEGFNKAFEDHKNLSRAWGEQKFKWWLADDSEATTALHSATHLLLAGLNHVLGGWIHQKWSNITAERLRFDFNHEWKVEREQLDEVETFVNNAIQSGFEVVSWEMGKQEAMDSWVEWSFWEKYPEIVTVYTMAGKDGTAYSKELCWWPHVEDSTKMWTFKIKKEQASSKGIRRIKAVLI